MLRPRFLLPAAALVSVIAIVAACSKDKGTPYQPGPGTAGGVLADTLNAGAMFTHYFANNGTYGYHCNFHPAMTGTVVVSASSPVADSVATVSIVSFAFNPVMVTIHTGGRVTWTNSAGIPHSVNSN